MIVPKRKTSKQRKRLRKSQDALVAVNPGKCFSCSRAILPHTVCYYCGFYKGKKVRYFKSLSDRRES